MSKFTSTLLRAVTCGSALVALALMAGADTSVSSIPLAPHGDGAERSSGQPVGLSPTAFLISTNGVDGQRTTADDKTLLISDVGGTPVTTALDTPFLSRNTGRGCRLSATSALVFGAGPDASWETDDDVVHVLTALGSANTVTTVTIGFLSNSGGGAPVRLSSDTALVCAFGPDGSEGTADDEIVVLIDLGGTNRVVRGAAPYLRLSGLSRPIPLSPSTFLLGSAGPDDRAGTADDETFLFALSGDALARTDLATPRLMSGAPGRATRVSATRAVVVSDGPDSDDSTADDVLYLLDDLGGSNSVTSITVGPVYDYSAGKPVALTDTLVVLGSPGADESYPSADDGLTIVSGLGTGNTVEFLHLGGIDEDRQARALRLSATSCAVVTGGPNSKTEDADDTIAVVTDVGGANAVKHVTVPGLAGGSTSTPIAVGSTALLVRCGGADADIGGADDIVAFLSDLDGTPVVEPTPTGPAESEGYSSAQVPELIGGGRAVFLAAGPDAELGDGGDDEVRVIEGLPASRSLALKKVWIKFKEAKPEKGEIFLVRGSLVLDTPDLFAGDDVTVSIGNASQTLPADAFTTNKKGTIVKYLDKKRQNGFIKKLVYNVKKGKVLITGKGVGTGAETTAPAYVPVTIECAELRLWASVAGVAKKKGILYKD